MGSKEERSRIRRIFSAIDHQVRLDFPDDFTKRCMYTAAATQALLACDGIDALICSGNMLGFVTHEREQLGSMRGYKSNHGEPVHFWVETEERLYDLAFSFLAIGGSPKSAALPPLAWMPKDDLPRCIRYEKQEQSLVVEAINNQERLEKFVTDCVTLYTASETRFRTIPLILFSRKGLEQQRSKNNIWAQAVAWFEENPQQALPIS